MCVKRVSGRKLINCINFSCSTTLFAAFFPIPKSTHKWEMKYFLDLDNFRYRTGVCRLFFLSQIRKRTTIKNIFPLVDNPGY